MHDAVLVLVASSCNCWVRTQLLLSRRAFYLIAGRYPADSMCAEVDWPELLLEKCYITIAAFPTQSVLVIAELVKNTSQVEMYT